MRDVQQRWDHLATLIATSDELRLVHDVVAALEHETGQELACGGRARPGDVVALRRFARVHRRVLDQGHADEPRVRRAVEAAIARVSGDPAEPAADRDRVAIPA